MTFLTTWQHINTKKLTMSKTKLALVVVASALVNVPTVMSVPVVPNFTQGSMNSHTETTSTVTETINSMDYSTGFTYSISGHGIQVKDDGALTPSDTTSATNTINGVNSQWTNLDLTTKPEIHLSTPGGSFSVVESYSGAGLRNHTVIQRTTTVTSVTDTTSIFQQ
mgnify:CR=1 FL=1|tara:strand:+ start:382 stop:879 length:498 start_codon:yes stop_codon:yes gene_type:complete